MTQLEMRLQVCVVVQQLHGGWCIQGRHTSSCGLRADRWLAHACVGAVQPHSRPWTSPPWLLEACIKSAGDLICEQALLRVWACVLTPLQTGVQGWVSNLVKTPMGSTARAHKLLGPVLV